jgi:hypothetical protein
VSPLRVDPWALAYDMQMFPALQLVGLWQPYGIVAGGIDHAEQLICYHGVPSCGSFRKVSALQSGAEPTPDPSRRREGRSAADLAARYLTVAQLQTRPLVRLVDRLA